MSFKTTPKDATEVSRQDQAADDDAQMVVDEEGPEVKKILS